MKTKKGEDKNKKNRFWYVLGGIAVAGGMCVMMPKLIEVGSDYLYRKNAPSVKPDVDTWGPEIVKRDTLEAQDGEV